VLPHRILALGTMAQHLSEELNHVDTHPVMPLASFQRLIASQSNPIGLIPLDASPFSACKSAVKHFDFTLCGLPVVASDVPPYSDVVVHQHNGWLVAPQAQAWADAIHTLGTSALLRQTLVDQARTEVQAQHTLQRNATAWQMLLTSLPSAPRLPTGLRRLCLELQHQWLPLARQALRRANERRKHARRAKR
jgi:hypothetical protein